MELLSLFVRVALTSYLVCMTYYKFKPEIVICNVDYINPRRERLKQKTQTDYTIFNYLSISCPLNRQRLRGNSYGI